MAPTTRSSASKSPLAALAATKSKKSTSKKGKATISEGVKKESAKKIAKATKKTTSPTSSMYAEAPIARSPSTARHYQMPGAYSPTGNDYQSSPKVSKYGMFGAPQPGSFIPTGKKDLAWEQKPKRGYFPTRYEIERFIGDKGRPLHELQSKFARHIRHHGKLFWEICLGIAYVDKRKRPYRVFLRDEFEEEKTQVDAATNMKGGNLFGGSVPASTSPVAGPSVPAEKVKKSSFAEGKSKSLNYGPGVRTLGQTMENEKAALRGKKSSWPSFPYWSPVPRTAAGYVADVNMPHTPTSTPTTPTSRHKGKGKATSPTPCKITVAAKSRRDANRVVKRQQLVQRGCTELKGLIEGLKERLMYFETLFERCAEGVDWETAELDVLGVQEKRLRFAE